MADPVWGVLSRWVQGPQVEGEARKTDVARLGAEAARLELLTRTGMVTQADHGQFLRLGLISRDDYLRLGGARLGNGTSLCRRHGPRSNTMRKVFGKGRRSNTLSNLMRPAMSSDLLILVLALGPGVPRTPYGG